MTAGGDRYTRIDHPREIQELLDVLYQPGGALLVMESPRASPLPVLLATASVGDVLRLDISAIRDTPEVRALRDGQRFRVMGRGPDGKLRTPALSAGHVWESERRWYCQCAFPGWLELLQRRDTFRARLHRGMHVRVDLQSGEAAARGLLRDLSMDGCRVEAELAAATLLDAGRQPLELTLTFPDGSRFAARARLRYRAVRKRCFLCGFRFEAGSRDQERQLWLLVREIEREAARNAASRKGHLRPSSLFSGNAQASALQPAADDGPPVRRR